MKQVISVISPPPPVHIATAHATQLVRWAPIIMENMNSPCAAQFSGAFGIARALTTYRSIPSCFLVPNFLLSVHVPQPLPVPKDNLTRAGKSEHALAVELRKRP